MIKSYADHTYCKGLEFYYIKEISRRSESPGLQVTPGSRFATMSGPEQYLDQSCNQSYMIIEF